MVLNVTTLSHGSVVLMLFVIYACHLQEVFNALIISWGCTVGRGVVLMLFVIYARH